VGTPRRVVSESRERTFDHDISDSGEQRAALARMAEELCESLARHGRSGRTIAIKVRLDDFTTVTRARTLAAPTRSPETVATHALELLEQYAPPRPVRLLGVRVAGLAAGAPPPAGAERGLAPQLALPV